RRRVRVLEVGHEDPRAGVERVDHHLAVDRPGDLAAAVDEVGRRGRDAPVAVADTARLPQERGILAGVETRLPLAPRLEQLHPPRIGLAVEPADERETFARERVLEDDAHAVAGSFVNCASSVEPLSASVSLSGETACVTRSK